MARTISVLISILAPARGATTVCFRTWDDNQFQFSPLREGRLEEIADVDIMIISILAPARGATTEIYHVPKGKTISILAPARGATQMIATRRLKFIFQFSPLREGRHVGRDAVFITDRISILAPARGATIRLWWSVSVRRFQFSPLR